MTTPPGAPVLAALECQPWRETGVLSLRGMGLKALPDLTAEAPRLVSLDLGGNRLRELPDWLWAAARLEYLSVAGNRLPSVPDDIGRLGSLNDLDLSDNRLTGLPVGLGGCARLRRVDLSKNKLSDVRALAGLALTWLNLAANGLAELPDLPETLEWLDLGANQLAALPGSIGQLRRLRRLDLSGNRLTDAALDLLVQLPVEECYLDDNAFSRPVRAEQFPRLRRLSQQGNPLTEPAGARDRLSEIVAETVRQYLSGAPDPEKQFYDAPTYSYDVALQVDRPGDTQQVLDLYYKRFSDVPAELTFGDGTTVQLTNLSRGTAFDLTQRHGGLDMPVSLRVNPTKSAYVVSAAEKLLSQAVARVDAAELVPTATQAAATRFAQPELSPAARVLNAAVTDAQRRVLAVTDPLAPQRDYGLRVDIGALSVDSVVLDPPAFRLDLLQPDTAEGFWFDVVVTSSDLEVPSDAARLFLPLTGASWVCGCAGPEHACKPVARQPYLFLPIRTREPTTDATLRCTVYHEGNAVQSLKLHCVVTPDGAGHGRIVGVVDHQLAEDAGLAGELPPRQLNLFAAQAAGGTHQITINGGGRTIPVDLAETQVSTILTEIRRKLLEITLGPTGKTSQYDEENRKPLDAFLTDLKGLGRLGAQLAQAVVPRIEDQRYLRDHLRTRATVQISRVTKTVFPWALIYDIPTETDFAWTLCPLLANWETERDALADYPEACPHEAAHDINVLCPYGFWGFRHIVEQPPSVRDGVLRTEIRLDPTASAATARSLALDAALTQVHFDELTACLRHRFALVECGSKQTLREALADPRLPLLYFYCHGRKAELANTKLVVPLLEIGSADRIGATDFAAWVGGWDPTHWQDTAPLVFLNGCETAALDPEDVVSFVDALAGLRAAGVIGTEIAVTQRVAGEIALRFWRLFAGEPAVPVGTALHRSRIDLLRKNNISGLAYTPFCSADLALSPA